MMSIQCKWCGSSFETYPSKIAGGRGVYCSKQCSSDGRMSCRDSAYIQRFSFPEPNSGCWIWDRGSYQGYGSCKVRGHKRMNAHRLSYIVHKGEIPIGLVVRHTCDNKSCVNPDHLVCGTQQQNIIEAKERGLLAWGARNSVRKLTADQVLEARAAHANGESCMSIAKRMGVRLGTISDIIRGISWRDVSSSEVSSVAA